MNELVPNETKGLVTSAQQQANALKVTTPDEAAAAAELLTQIKGYHKSLLAKKEEMTRPLMASLASLRNLFKPLESDLNDAEKTVKDKLLAFTIESDEKRDKEEAKIAARVAKGTLRPETAARKMGEMEEPQKVKGVTTRVLTKIRIVDETAIPREYMIPNIPAITEAVLHRGEIVQGVEKYEEKILAATASAR